MTAIRPDAYFTADGLAATIRAGASEADFPQYAYGLIQAVALAGALDVAAISALEIGVAGGNGLVALERLRDVHAPASGVEIAVAGFDLGSGMPAPQDYRDLPYIWRESFFRMDEPKLRARLQSAELFIGDIAQTIPRYLAGRPAPIGFISFDVDYYSSTLAAFAALLDAAPERFLPRVICYFDDTVGPHHEMHSDFTGELLAISEFNAAHARCKIGKLSGMRHKIAPLDGPWVEGIFVLHLFDHPRYCDYIYPVRDRQFDLTD